MKLTTFYLFLALSTTAQPIPGISGDTLTSSSGFSITKGQKLKIGVGSTPDGDFKFIRRNSASLFAYSSTTGYQGLANQANAFGRSNAGLSYAVLRNEKRGTKKNGYVFYTIISQGMLRYEIDVDNAIATGELVVPDEFKPKPKALLVEMKPATSVADELAKLKKLLDDGIITQEEFAAQKKKLLEN